MVTIPEFSQGPCRKGKLFYLDPDTGKTGCDCRPEWEAYYYAVNDKCYEQESKVRGDFRAQ